jgi:hypothetical protein
MPANVIPLRRHVSKSRCTKALRYLFGPHAYFRTLRDEQEHEVGLEVVVLHKGERLAISRAKLEPGKEAGRNDPDLPFELLRAAAKEWCGAVVSVTWDKSNAVIHVQIPIERQVPIDMSEEAAVDRAGRVAESVEAVVCRALESFKLPINAPMCDDCQGGCATGNETACRAWAVWARRILDAKRAETTPEELAQARDALIKPKHPATSPEPGPTP